MDTSSVVELAENIKNVINTINPSKPISAILTGIKNIGKKTVVKLIARLLGISSLPVFIQMNGSYILDGIEYLAQKIIAALEYDLHLKLVNLDPRLFS